MFNNSLLLVNNSLGGGKVIPIEFDVTYHLMVSPVAIFNGSVFTAATTTDRDYFADLLPILQGDIQSRDFPVLISKSVPACVSLIETPGARVIDLSFIAIFPPPIAGDANLWMEVLNTAYISLIDPNSGREMTLPKSYARSGPSEYGMAVEASYKVTQKSILPARAGNTFPLEITFHKAA